MENQPKQIKIKMNFIVFIIVFAITFACFSFYYFYNHYQMKSNFQNETNQNANLPSPFKISKIYLYSSADATQNDTANKTTWNVNVSQFTDIAIFIDNEGNLTQENTIQNLYLDNFKYTKEPSLGQPILYYKNQNDFGKISYTKEKKIKDTLNYTIIPYEQTIDYSNPETYDSKISPVCVGFVNQDIKTNYAITNTQDGLHYDGRLLKQCQVGLSSINCSVTFDVHIVNQLGNHFVSNVTIDIPLKDSNSNKTIYDGYLIEEVNDLDSLHFYAN